MVSCFLATDKKANRDLCRAEILGLVSMAMYNMNDPKRVPSLDIFSTNFLILRTAKLLALVVKSIVITHCLIQL